MLSSTREIAFDGNAERVGFLGVTLDPAQRWDLLSKKLTSCTYALRQLSQGFCELLTLQCSVQNCPMPSWLGGIHHLGIVYFHCRGGLFALSDAGYRDECWHLFPQRGILTYPSVFALESLCYIRKP